MNNSTATDLYSRIDEATRLIDRPSVVRACRVILEAIFRHLTAGEARAFNGLFARTQFVFDQMQVNRGIKEQINSLRILSNKAAHENLVINEKDALLCIKTLCLTVEYFFGLPIPTNLVSYYASVSSHSFVRPISQQQPTIPEIKLVVVNVKPVHELSDGAKYFILTGRDDQLGEFELQLWKSEENDLTILQPLLQPYFTMHVFNAQKVKNCENTYSSTRLTQVVLEPDLLLDISELAECFSRSAQPLLFLLKKFLPQEYSKAAFQGNMVNALLDAALQTDQPDLKAVFREAVAEQVFQAAAYGKNALNEIYLDVRSRHWSNLTQVAQDLRRQPLRIEPTFYSARYGLQGRLDVLAEDPTDHNIKDVYELKSGKAPDNGLWPNNKIQVVGYNMLLRSVFGHARRGTSAIIYSCARKEPLRHVATTMVLENQLLEVRNTVVAWLLQLAEGNFSVLDTITATKGVGQPSFIANSYVHFHERYQPATSETKAYYQSFLSFTIREWLNAKAGMYGSEEREGDNDGFAALWLYTEEEKRKGFNIIPGLTCETVDAKNAILSFGRQQQVQHNFRPGDTVLVYPRLEGALPPLQQQILKGRLDAISPDKVSVSLNNRQMDSSYFQNGQEWILEHDIYESSHWTTTRGLFHVLDPENRDKFSLLLGKCPPAEPSRVTLPLPGLNSNQQEIINNAFNAQDYYLIQGPPGTGKTSTVLTQLVKALQEKEQGSIALVAFTNRAVSEIAANLEKANISFLRMGSRGSGAEQQLRNFCLDGQIHEACDFIQGQRVILSTVATLANRLDLLRLLKTDLNTLIVDEASQLTEPQLVSLAMRFTKFILIGDQNQLPPVVAQHECYCRRIPDSLQQMGMRDLRFSLFERLMDLAKANRWDSAWGLLTTHFRMHREIADVINPWYAGQLKPGSEEQEWDFSQTHLLNVPPWSEVLAAGRLVFIPSPPETTSKYHRTEAERIVGLLRYIQKTKGSTFSPETVGVVTPWRTQIAEIRSLLSDDDEKLNEVNIETVERFQGSENDIILVSLAIYHSGQLRVLKCPGSFTWENNDSVNEAVSLDRKLLVTISRARNQVVLLGDERVIKSDAHFRRVVEMMKRVQPLQWFA